MCFIPPSVVDDLHNKHDHPNMAFQKKKGSDERHAADVIEELGLGASKTVGYNSVHHCTGDD